MLHALANPLFHFQNLVVSYRRDGDNTALFCLWSFDGCSRFLQQVRDLGSIDELGHFQRCWRQQWCLMAPGRRYDQQERHHRGLSSPVIAINKAVVPSASLALMLATRQT